MTQLERKLFTLSGVQTLIFGFFLFIEIAVFSFLLLESRKPPVFLSPTVDNPDLLPLPTIAPKPKDVYGFFPYWISKEEVNFRYSLLTHLAYFSLELDKKGEIKKMNESGYREPSWDRLADQIFSAASRKIKESGGKIILVVTALDNETISLILAQPHRRQKAIEEIIDTIETKNIDGVNLNLEYAGAPPQALIRDFTKFVGDLRQSLPDRIELSVDVFADSARKIRIFNIPQLAEIVDRIIIMGYDFHRPISAKAGPIAPIRGNGEKYEQNLSWSLSSFLKIVPPEKIILGVPYYGYEWQTLSDQPNSMVIPNTGALATYKRVRKKIEEENLEPLWDQVALSPYLVFKEGGRWHQIYYENETSLAYKYQLVDDLGLGGIAIWALGYDGDYPELWELLEKKFTDRE